MATGPWLTVARIDALSSASDSRTWSQAAFPTLNKPFRFRPASGIILLTPGYSQPPVVSLNSERNAVWIAMVCGFYGYISYTVSSILLLVRRLDIGYQEPGNDIVINLQPTECWHRKFWYHTPLWVSSSYRLFMPCRLYSAQVELISG